MYTRGPILFAFAVLFLSRLSTAVAADIPRIVSLKVLRDTPASTSLEQIRQRDAAGDFLPLPDSKVHLGYQREDHWFRVEIAGGAQRHMGVLEFSNARLGVVTLYRSESEGDQPVGSAGVRVPFWTRQVPGLAPAFQIWTRPNEARVYYFSLQNFGSLRFDLRLWSLSEHNRHANLQLAAALLIAGALLALTVYNFCIYLHLRQSGYLWIALFLFTCTIWQMAASGTANMFLWPNAALWSRHALLLTGSVALVVGALMANALLDARRLSPGLARASVAVAAVTFLGTSLSLANLPAALYAALVGGLLSPALMLALAITAKRQGSPAALPFLCSWGLVLAGSVVANLVGPGYLPANEFTLHFMDIALVLAGLGWSFALTGRLKASEREQRQLLESLVAERTAELKSALDAVKTLAGLLPICSCCKKIRNDQGYWQHVESYLQEHTEADFSHGICPDCAHEHYPEYFPRGDSDSMEKDS